MQPTGHTKDYGSDPAKREIRRKFLDFIEQTFNKNTHRGTTALCLAGQELWEFNEVFSHLNGMRKSNLSVVERNPLNARLIKASIPDAEVFAGELLDYVKTTNKRFDIISLDFCSSLSPNVAKIIETIRLRELLNDRGCMLVAVSGKRENNAGKSIMREMVDLALLHTTPAQTVNSVLRGEAVPQEIVERQLGLVRGDSFTHAVTCYMLGGPNTVYYNWLKEHGNSALRQRIVERAFRTYVGARVVANSENAINPEMGPSQRVPGVVMEGLGIKYGTGGYISNPSIERALTAIKEGPMQICDLSGIDAVNLSGPSTGTSDNPWAFKISVELNIGIFLVDQIGWERWTSNFWHWLDTMASVNLAKSLDEIQVDQLGKTEMVCWSLFKDAIHSLFIEDIARQFKFGSFKVEFPNHIAYGLFEYIFGGLAGVYWLSNIKRFKYISDSNCPMLVDMYRVDRTFLYNQVVDVSPDGRFRPFVPEKIIKTGDQKRIKRSLNDSFEDFHHFVAQIVAGFSHTDGSEYPPRVEVIGEPMGCCDNCSRLDTELDLLKAQLREMKDVIASKKQMRRTYYKLGDYERRKIAEMLRTQMAEESIIKELKVSKQQIAAVKAWVTMRGGFDAYLQHLDGKDPA